MQYSYPYPPTTTQHWRTFCVGNFVSWKFSQLTGLLVRLADPLVRGPARANLGLLPAHLGLFTYCLPISTNFYSFLPNLAANCNIIAIVSIEHRTFQGQFLHSSCVSNRKFRTKWRLYCNSHLILPWFYRESILVLRDFAWFYRGRRSSRN